MAIGLGACFGIRLPLNFASPYKASNIIDFWRRWHITLSTFFRDYIYFPLGGSRSGTARTLFNLIVTMLLGGLWHGAGWTFVFWGLMHGLYLAVNHGWRLARRSLLGHDLGVSTLAGRTAGDYRYIPSRRRLMGILQGRFLLLGLGGASRHGRTERRRVL